MTVEFPNDALFDAFAEENPAIYVNADGERSEVRVIFDQSFVQARLGLNRVATDAPVAICRTVDVSDADHQATIEIGGVLYKIVSPEPDGAGLTVLNLSRE